MTERQFQTELLRGLRHEGFHVIPIPDSGGGSRFGVRRCYDLGIAADGVYYGVELKRGSTSIPFDALQDHQRAGLAECSAAGHVPIVIALFVHDGELIGGRQKVRKSRRTLEAWAMEYCHWKGFEKRGERKSIPLATWREYGDELTMFKVPTDTKRGWEWGWSFRGVHDLFKGEVKTA